MGYDVTVSKPSPPALIALHADEQARAFIETELGVCLPAYGAVGVVDDLTAFAIGPTEWLLVAPPSNEEAIVHRIQTAAGSAHFAAVVMSDAFCHLRLTGPQVHDALCQVVAVDWQTSFQSPGTALRCAFGKTSAVVHYADGSPTFDIFVESPLTGYATKLLEVACGAPK